MTAIIINSQTISTHISYRLEHDMIEQLEKHQLLTSAAGVHKDSLSILISDSGYDEM